MSTGWQCPACAACYAPFVTECRRCNAPVVTGTGTGDAVVVPSVFSPLLICSHLDCEDTTIGKRCKACGYLIPTFTWTMLPPTAVYSTGLVRHAGSATYTVAP